jgi:hypothetical protein
MLPSRALAFTICQVPVCYRLADSASLTVTRDHGGEEHVEGSALDRGRSAEIFGRSGSVVRVLVDVRQRDMRP